MQEVCSVIPQHLGLILDGNRRWARAQGYPQLEGHRRGYENLFKIASAAVDRGVKYVSAYIFSTENWNRAQEEVNYLMDLLVWVATKEIEKYDRNGLKIVFLASRSLLSDKVKAAVEYAEQRTQKRERGVVAFCLNYGGHTELAEGVANLLREGISPQDVTPARLAHCLYHPEIPEVDLVLRTSGEQRLSGFMLWRIAYAELYFTGIPWPAFTSADLDSALGEFAARQRRYGK